jgi:hypothetical protein
MLFNFAFVIQTGANALVNVSSLGFHVWWLHGTQMSGVQRCPMYGRFGADHIFYQDTIPESEVSMALVSLVLSCNHTEQDWINAWQVCTLWCVLEKNSQ